MAVISSNINKNKRINSKRLLESLNLKKSLKMSQMEKPISTSASYFDFLREAITTEYQPTGRSLGTGSFAIAIEVVHLPTGKKYVAKIIPADRLRGYERGIVKEIQIMLDYSKKLGYNINTNSNNNLKNENNNTYDNNNTNNNINENNNKTNINKNINNNENVNILRLIDCFRIVENGQTHICMIVDLCDSNDLFDAICEFGAFPEVEARRIIHSLLGAVHYLHNFCGMAHRDIKAENILLLQNKEYTSNIDSDSNLDLDTDIGMNLNLDKNGNWTTATSTLANEKSNNNSTTITAPTANLIPVLADFGLAEYCQENDEKGLTEYCGTPGTTAPEVLRNEPYGVKCDIYSIGALTYFLLAGYRPFDWTTTPREEYDAVLSGKYDYPEESFGSVSSLARDFIDQCMCLDPKKRLSAEEALAHPWFSN